MEILIALISSGILSTLITNIFTTINNNKAEKREAERRQIERTEGLETIRKQMKKIEKDSVRTQLLMLMSDFPDNDQEIIEVAQHYFCDIGGNWYMTKMFSKWLTDNGFGQPEWFKKGEQ